MHTKSLVTLFKGLFILALISFFIGLWIPYIGEEGVYTISSYEMWFHKHFLYPTLYGIPYWRPPLFNWLIIFFSNIIGWGHMLVASRFVTAGATIANSILLIWLGKRLFKTKYFGLFAGLIYLTSDALFYHGWIAYADPLFAFFTASSIALLWIANLEQRTILVWLASLALIAAFMTKALTRLCFLWIIFYYHCLSAWKT